MSNDGLPSITIVFKSKGTTAIVRGNRGIVALILKDSTNNGLITMNSIDDIPTTLSEYNQEQISKTWIGNVNAPIQVLAYVLSQDATDYSAAMTALESVKWNYLAVPGISSADATIIATWIKGLRDNSNKKVKAILPNTAEVGS